MPSASPVPPPIATTKSTPTTATSLPLPPHFGLRGIDMLTPA